MVQISVDSHTCNGCGACTLVCTGHVYTMAESKKVEVTPDLCWKCGHCVAACPVEAIDHSEYPLSVCPSINGDSVVKYEDLISTFRERRSTRAFKEKQIPRDILQELLEIGRYAPTGSNSQSIDWLVIDNPGTIRELSIRTVRVLAKTGGLLRNPLLQLYFRISRGPEMVREMKLFGPKIDKLRRRSEGGEDPIFFRAPAVVVAHAPKSDGSARDNAIHALYNVELAARRIGLGTCQMGFVKFALDRSRPLRELLTLPSDRNPEAALAIGYPQVMYHRALPRRKPRISWMD